MSTTSKTGEHSRISRALNIIAAKQGKRTRHVVARVRELRPDLSEDQASAIVNGQLKTTGNNKELDLIAQALDVDKNSVIERARDIEEQHLKGITYLEEILEQLEVKFQGRLNKRIMAVLVPFLSKLKGCEDPRINLEPSYVLIKLHELAHAMGIHIDSIPDLARTVGFNLPNYEKDERPSAPIPPLKKESVREFKDAVRFLMKYYHDWDPDSLRPISINDYNDFISTNYKLIDVDKNQSLFKKLSDKLSSNPDPNHLIAYAEKKGEAIFPHYKSFPIIFGSYRKKQVEAAKKVSDREAINDSTAAISFDVIERNETIRFGNLMSNKTARGDEACIQYIKDVEDKPWLTPWSVSVWLERLYAGAAISNEYSEAEQKTGVNRLMQKVIKDSGMAEQFPLPQEKSEELIDRITEANRAWVRLEKKKAEKRNKQVQKD